MVRLCGPDGRGYALTVEAAVETSARLLVAAARAGEQQAEAVMRA